MSKRALVFGHTHGLGMALANLLISEGYEVVGVSKSSRKDKSPKLQEIKADLSQEDDINKAIKAIKQNYSQFDVLAYMAGILTAHDIDNIDYYEMQHSYQVNTFAPMFIESQLLDLIKKNGTDIINVTSSALIDFYPKYAEYSSSKAAFAKFTKDLQKALIDTKARVTDFCAGAFSSNIYKVMTGDKVERDESIQIKPEDMAALIYQLIKLPKRMEVPYIYINRKLD